MKIKSIEITNVKGIAKINLDLEPNPQQDRHFVFKQAFLPSDVFR